MTLSAPIASDAATITLDPNLVSLMQTVQSSEPAAVEKPPLAFVV